MALSLESLPQPPSPPQITGGESLDLKKLFILYGCGHDG